jgi:hypothetical protein
MKRAIGLIAATLLTTSIYSQDYSNSGSLSNPDSTPDYRSRQSEAGAPASSESSVSSSAGYDKAPGLSGGNSSTGQSNGSNVGSASEQYPNVATPEDQSLTTRDSDLSGSEYRGTLQSEPDQSFNSELNGDRSSNSGSSGSSVSGSDSSDLSTGELKGSGTADGAFHEPAAPVREGSQSEGWSSSGTFSGAGPGSVTGSNSSGSSSDLSSSLNSSSSSYDRATSPTESSNSFSSDVSNNSALSNRDQDLINRGLEPDSDQLSRSELNGDQNNDTLIMEDWTIITPDSESNVGAPAENESGAASSSDYSSRDDLGASSSMNFSSSTGSDSYSQDLYRRTQKDWSARTGTTDVPATPGLMDQSLDELGRVRFYNDTTQSDVGAPGSSVSGSGSKADDDSECDHDKNVNKGSAPDYEHGDRSSSDESSSKYHINRGEDDKYHINREASGDRSSSDSTSAPGDYGDRPDASNYDDGHLSGNNAIGSSRSSESSSNSSSSDQSQRSTDGSLYPPDL